MIRPPVRRAGERLPPAKNLKRATSTFPYFVTANRQRPSIRTLYIPLKAIESCADDPRIGRRLTEHFFTLAGQIEWLSREHDTAVKH